MAKTKTASERDLQIIRRIIGPQLQKEQSTTIHTFFTKPFDIKYCTIEAGIPNDSTKHIILVPGFGSGWTGTMRLGYELAKFGHRVTAISLLGYGNSSNPPCHSYFSEKFEVEAGNIRLWAWETFPKEELCWVGHSMSAPMLTTLASWNPELFESLILLNPAGFEKRNVFELAYKFALNGIGHGIAFNGDPIWEELQKFLPREKSPFTSDRIIQRLNEGLRVCRKTIEAATIRKIQERIPVLCITGEKDFVFPYQKILMQPENIKVLPDSWHNTTMFGSERTAAEIHKFISNIK